MSSDIVSAVLERVEREAGLRARVVFAGHTLVYSTNTLNHFDWLRSYTAPQYGIEVALERAPVCVSSYENARFEEHIRHQLEALPRYPRALFQGYTATEVDLGEGWTAFLHTSRRSIILVSRRAGRCVTLGVPSDFEAKLDPIRCLREIFAKTLELDGHFVFHAGAVGLNGHGVAICGVKGAGKTTTALSLVESGAAFLTNDRSFIGAVGDGLWIHPWPTVSPIGMGTLYHFPALRSWMDQGGWAYEIQDRLTESATHEQLSTLTATELAALPDKLHLTSDELARSLGSTVARAAPLECLVLPGFDLSRQSATLAATPPECAAELLLSQCFTPHDAGYPDWLGWRAAADDDLAAAAHALVSRLVESIPCVTLKFSDLRGLTGRRILDELLAVVSSRRNLPSRPD